MGVYIYIYKTLNLEAIRNEMSQFLNIEQYVNQKQLSTSIYGLWVSQLALG